jgi:hypothetical protein
MKAQRRVRKHKPDTQRIAREIKHIFVNLVKIRYKRIKSTL